MQGPFGCRMTVQNSMKIVWTVFEKFEIFMKCREKKRHNCVSRRKFFPTHKNIQNIKIFRRVRNNVTNFCQHRLQLLWQRSYLIDSLDFWHKNISVNSRQSRQSTVSEEIKTYKKVSKNLLKTGIISGTFFLRPRFHLMRQSQFKVRANKQF